MPLLPAGRSATLHLARAMPSLSCVASISRPTRTSRALELIDPPSALLAPGHREQQRLGQSLFPSLALSPLPKLTEPSLRPPRPDPVRVQRVKPAQGQRDYLALPVPVQEGGRDSAPRPRPEAERQLDESERHELCVPSSRAYFDDPSDLCFVWTLQTWPSCLRCLR